MPSKAWQDRVDSGRRHHGMGPSDYFPGVGHAAEEFLAALDKARVF